jgi:hypothetical protein
MHLFEAVIFMETEAVHTEYAALKHRGMSGFDGLQQKRNLHCLK